MSRVAVIQYPGSNCDLDALEILQKVEKTKAELIWHKDLKGDDYDAYVLPGGFSYGDYLRAGAIAATSPSLKVVREAVDENKPVLGICNGLQILVEAGMLPGAVLRNSGLRSERPTCFSNRCQDGASCRSTTNRWTVSRHQAFG